MRSTPPAERTLLDRFLAVIPVAVALLALLSLLFWEASIRRSPTVFSDELEWTQLSRAIAATGHAARRGEPIHFKSLYAFLIAPWWWIHSTNSAYTAIKYANTIVMALAAIPTFLIARTMVSTRAATVAALASLCTTAFFYAGFLLPESLAYPTFMLCAWVSIRALAGGGRRWIVAAIVLDLAATEVRGELIVLPGAFALAAAVLWVVGPRGQRMRRGWSKSDYAGATRAAARRRDRAEQAGQPRVARMGDGDAVVARPDVVARHAGGFGTRDRARAAAVRRRLGVALDPRATQGPGVARLRGLHRRRDHHGLDLHRGEGSVPLDGLRDPHRGAQPHLPRAAADRRDDRLAPLAASVAPGRPRGTRVHGVARPALRLSARLSVLRGARAMAWPRWRTARGTGTSRPSGSG